VIFLKIILSTMIYVATAALALGAGYGIFAAWGIGMLVMLTAWGMVVATIYEDFH
jgi:hypothetical protein